MQTAFWMITSTLILIGTIKYRYPLIPPQAQAIIATFEFVTFSFFVRSGQAGFDYISTAYLYWTEIEIVQMIEVIIKGKHIILYLFRVILVVGIIHAAMLITENIYAFSYFTTFIGEIIWFRHILRKEYPMNSIVLIAFMTKFLADVIAVPVYIGMGDLVNRIICAALPILDFLFLVVYFVKTNKNAGMVEKA